MTSRQFPLIDASAGLYAADAVIDVASTGINLSDQPWKVELTRFIGGPSDGIDLLLLDNGHLQLFVIPTRGMGIWKAECGTLPLKWDSPVRFPVHPALVDQSRRGGIGWLDGFNEAVCRCGLAWHGAPGTDVRRDEHGTVISEQFLPLHGRIANLPAHHVSVQIEDSGQISVTGIVDETSVFGEQLRLTSVLTTQAGSSEFSIHDTVSNIGGAESEVELLYHCNFGTPLLGAGSSFHTAATRVAPRDERAAEGVAEWESFLGPTPGYAEQVYFIKPVSSSARETLAVLSSPDGETGLGVRFDTSTLPWLTLWKNTQAAEDGYCCGIEPGGSLPNNRSFERDQGRVVTLGPGESREYRLKFEIAETTEQTQALIEEVNQLQRHHQRVTESTPAADLSPA